MTDELVAYLLDDLPGERRAAVEERLASDPAWRSELDRLQQCLAATTDPALCKDEPPSDLVVRTCGLVERSEACGLSDRSVALLTGAPMTALSEPAMAGKFRRWSLADCTVCAGVLGVLAMLMLPAMRESRDAARRTVCQDKLRALGTVLYNYQEAHGNQLPAVQPGEPTGICLVKLANAAGENPQEFFELLVCPESTDATRLAFVNQSEFIPVLVRLNGAQGPERNAVLRKVPLSYAYRLGYFDKNRTYHLPRFTGDSNEPLCADAPTLSRRGLLFTSHGGNGQNVLSQDISVRFWTKRHWGQDDIYTNHSGRPAAGEGYGDVVLVGRDVSADGDGSPFDGE